MDIDVYTPCPISTCGMISVTAPSAEIRMKALGAKLVEGDAVAAKAARCAPATR
jgi:hypothetical protein